MADERVGPEEEQLIAHAARLLMACDVHAGDLPLKSGPEPVVILTVWSEPAGGGEETGQMYLMTPRAAFQLSEYVQDAYEKLSPAQRGVQPF